MLQPKTHGLLSCKAKALKYVQENTAITSQYFCIIQILNTKVYVFKLVATGSITVQVVTQSGPVTAFVMGVDATGDATVRNQSSSYIYLLIYLFIYLFMYLKGGCE